MKSGMVAAEAIYDAFDRDALEGADIADYEVSGCTDITSTSTISISATRITITLSTPGITERVMGME